MKKKLLTLSGAGFAACFRVLVVDLGHVFIGRTYSLITQYFFTTLWNCAINQKYVT